MNSDSQPVEGETDRPSYAPDVVWVGQKGVESRFVKANANTVVHESKFYVNDVKYVRADTLDALVAERDALRDALEINSRILHNELSNHAPRAITFDNCQQPPCFYARSVLFSSVKRDEKKDNKDNLVHHEQ